MPFSSVTINCSAALRPQTQVSKFLCIPSRFQFFKFMCITTDDNSTNLRCQGAWHTAKRDRGVVSQIECSANACCNAWHWCIVKDTVKMIHFQSNTLQYTIRCPQKVYIVSKRLLNMFFTLKTELNFQPMRVSITNGIWLITILKSWTDQSHSWVLLLLKLEAGWGLTLRIRLQYPRWWFWNQGILSSL